MLTTFRPSVRRIRRLTAAVAVAAVLALLISTAGAADLRFGRAAVKITPTEVTGGVKPVLDDLYVKAMVLESGADRAAVAVCDLPVINRPVVEDVRQLVEERTDIPGSNVMVSATHSHTGLTPGWAGTSSFPALSPPKEGKEAEEAKRYTSFLTKSIAAAIARAREDLKPARVSAAVGHEDSLPFNRRFRMKDGTVVFNPGLLNPDIVRPAGPIDPEVPVAYFEDLDGRPLATVVNYALHLDTVGGNVYSADYPWMVAKLLGKVRGPEMMTLFTIGTAGNINHLDVSRPRPQKGIEEAARIGTVLAAEVLKSYHKLQPVSSGRLAVKREMVPLPPVVLKPGDGERARELAARGEAGGKRLSLLERVFAQRVFFAERQQGRPYEVEVQVIAIGDDLAWVGLPGEVFVELGMAIKQGSPFRFTTVQELTNEWIRYVPNRRGFEQGSYEAINTRCGPGGGEMLVEAAIRCLLALHEAPRQPFLEESRAH